MQVTKTKLGYFVCRKATYAKVKKLHGYYLRALRQAAKWKRWYAKAPKNRVVQTRTYENGRTTLGVILPVTEPKLLPIFTKKEVVSTYYDRDGHYVEGGIEIEKVSVCDMGICALFQAVRKPKKYQKNLPEVTTTLVEIEAMLYQILVAGW